MARELEDLLFRIRDGQASTDEVERARSLVAVEQRLPDELREVIDFRDDPAGDAAGLLAVLGADSLFGEVLREGVEAELAPQVEPETLEASNREEVVPEEVWPLSEVFAAAVRYEAGEVELALPVVQRVGLQVPQVPLVQAVRAESGRVQLAAAVLEAVGLPVETVQVAEAVREEAGEVEVESFVAEGWISAMVDGELDAEARQAAIRNLRAHPEAGATMTAFASLGTELRHALREEAEEVGYLWGDVARAIGVDPEAVRGWDGAAVAEAIRTEAGEVDVADVVMARVVRPLPTMIAEPEPLPEPANTGRSWSGLLMAIAAAAVLLIAVPTTWNQTGGAPTVEISSAQFAAADEIVIENLDYGENSNVQQMMGDEGALILWVDEGSVQ